MTTALGLGSGSLANLSSGTNDVAVGLQAGVYLKTGSNNTLFGNQAGTNLVTGGNNVYIGNLSGTGQSDESNMLRIYSNGSSMVTGNFSTGAITISGSVTSTNTVLTNTTNQIVLGTTHTTTITATAPSVSRTYTIPDIANSGTFLVSSAINSDTVVTIDHSGHVSTIAPLGIAQGGTNSAVALTNKRLMYSSLGKIVVSQVVSETGADVTTDVSTYSTGTASQISTTVTFSGSTLTSSMVGGLLVYLDGNAGFITSVNVGLSAASLDRVYSESVSTFIIYFGGCTMYNSGFSAENAYLGNLFAGNAAQSILATTAGSVTLNGTGANVPTFNAGTLTPLSLLVPGSSVQSAVTIYNSSTTYPRISLLAFAQDNLDVLFDSAYNGSNFTSSSTTGCFAIQKLAGSLNITGFAATSLGQTFSFSNLLSISTIGMVTDVNGNIMNQLTNSSTQASTGAIVHVFTATYYKVGNFITCKLVDNSSASFPTSNNTITVGVVPTGWGPTLSNTYFTGFYETTGNVFRLMAVNFNGNSIILSTYSITTTTAAAGSNFLISDVFSGSVNYFTYC